MRGRIPDAFIDDLLARVDIVDVIGQRVVLKKAGRDWSARCPFHDERSPSFTVSPNKQFFHCFGCGAHGSAIKFLMDYDRLEFLDAVEELAAMVGVQVPRDAARRERDDAGELYDILDASARWFQTELASSAVAQDYFARRGLDDAIRQRFRVGYAPDGWDGLKSRLGTSAQRIAALEKTGMLTSGDGGRRYDRFRKRVMFPILDRRGRTIAFGGRVLGADDGPKYLNSPETPLFHKGRELFGLWQVRDANTKIARLIVVEGYMDVIALHQYGVTQAVATLGTATTGDHAETLFRNAADVFFCFDGDRAGRQAAWRAVESVLPRMRDGRQAWFLFLPDGEDPDSLIRKEGVDGFEQRLREATPLSDFFFAEQSRDVQLSSIEGKARLAERAAPMLARIPDGAFRDLMVDELKRLSGSRVHFGAATGTAAAHVVRADFRVTKTPRQRSLVRTAVSLLLQHPAIARAIEPPWDFIELRVPGIGLLIELIDTCRVAPDIGTAALIERFADRDEGPALHKLALVEFPGAEAEWRVEFEGAIDQLRTQTRQQALDDLLRRQAETGLDDAGRDELRQLLVWKSTRRPRED